MQPRRGEIWWVALDPTLGSEIAKTRPCLIVTTDTLNQHRRTVVVIPLSRASAAHPPLLIPITCGERKAAAVVDQIRAVSKQRLRERIGRLTTEELLRVEEAVRRVLEV